MAMIALANAQFHHPTQFRPSGGGNSFVPSLQQEHRESQTTRPDDATPSAAINYRQQSYEYEEEEDIPQSTQQPNRRQQFLRPSAYVAGQQQQSQQQKQNAKNRFEDELEVEEPDRLALFLEKSTFQCEGRTGLV